jgi:hypothetical protein
MIPWGWYPKIYFLVGGSFWLLCSRAGKYEANSDQIGDLRINSKR